MKRITLFICALIVSAISFAQTTAFVCAVEFRRNNGAGCLGLNGGRIIFDFTTCPSSIPEIIEVRSNGTLLPLVTFAANGGCNGQGEIEYCFSDNIPSATTLCFKFRIDGVEFDCCFGQGGVLPVQLNSFVAARKGNSVNLKWSTSSEINAKEFVIQKKTSTGFIDVATIPASNLSNGSSYTFTDNNSAKGITEYRIKMVDLNGSYKASDIRAIKGLSGTSDFTVYPNPSTGNTTVALSESFDKAVVQLMDHAGRVIKTEKMENNGSTSFRNLIPGMYLIKVTNTVTGEAVSKKLTVVN